MVQFCECGGMLVPHSHGMKCRSCGKNFGNAKIAETSIKTMRKKKDITVIEDNRPDLPVTDKECPSCSAKQAYFWLIQTRSADEPPTQFFRCTKCKHTWREYK